MILEAENICKTFEGNPPVEVLQGISLKVQEGESLAIMGKSGEGKSTLLHILGTLEAPTSGSLSICGSPPTKSKIANIRNAHIGFVFQSYYLLEDFTVLENILMPIKIGRKLTEESVKTAQKLLKEVGLKGKESTSAKYLSGGEKQRVAIARSLINQPDLILADEPTGNLDEEHSRDIQSLLLEKAKQFGKALIVVTHDAEFAQKCGRVLFLKEGKLVSQSDVLVQV